MEQQLTYQTCEFCGGSFGLLKLDLLADCPCVKRQDAVFYVFSPNPETVWSKDDCDYEVVRNGRTEVFYTDLSGKTHRLCYTPDFDVLGIDTDEKLKEYAALGEPEWVWEMNSWFEVWDKNGSGFFSDPVDELDEAVALALKWDKERKHDET